ncbi:hypothetical protein SAMN02745157_5049 [Kaistia soli DSM 19436]|uniref:Uncharacterized protein n=1 Tax=Kaistia soli DSM 19436 TaxID=1122133 RepID=A0A1M5NMT5_9HYPH|nr:hypothetical protein SAMN02745157_5049 [Kaistia soli DSM 19436]
MSDPTSATRRRHSSRSSKTSSGKTLVPSDPIVSVYPLPMDAKRAKDEAVRARRLGKRLPVGHPYRRLPLWVPYWLARLINNSAPSSKPLPPEKGDG